MLWLGIGLAILIIAGWIIYSRLKGTVTLTTDQAEMVLGLVRKERTEIEKKRQAVIHAGAAQGDTLPLDGIFSHTENAPDHVKHELERRKKELFDRYGADIPVDVAYRLMKQLDPDEESPWSDNPGCFERHLQRREGNPLFPPERRVVTQKEIDEAKEKDRNEQERFSEKFQTFTAKTIALKNRKLPPTDLLSIWRETGELLEEAASIGESVGNLMQILQSTEDQLKQLLNQLVPDGTDGMTSMTNLSSMARIYYFAQSWRKDSPILKEEEIPALLSEDLGIISLAGYMSRSFAPNYRPNETDIKNHLEQAVSAGFSKERAEQIISAWNET
jgi:hypothetical protein